MLFYIHMRFCTTQHPPSICVPIDAILYLVSVIMLLYRIATISRKNIDIIILCICKTTSFYNYLFFFPIVYVILFVYIFLTIRGSTNSCACYNFTHGHIIYMQQTRVFRNRVINHGILFSLPSHPHHSPTICPDPELHKYIIARAKLASP